MRTTAPRFCSTTHSDPAPDAMPMGLAPVPSATEVTAPVVASTRATRSDPSRPCTVTQAAPASNTTSLALPPRSNRSTTRLDCGLMRASLPAVYSVTQTLPPPTATPNGCDSAWMVTAPEGIAGEDAGRGVPPVVRDGCVSDDEHALTNARTAAAATSLPPAALMA